MVTGTCYVVARPLRERARHPGMRICSKGAVLIADADADGERHLMPALRWQNYRGNKFHRIAKATISSMARIVRRPMAVHSKTSYSKAMPSGSFSSNHFSAASAFANTSDHNYTAEARKSP